VKGPTLKPRSSCVRHALVRSRLRVREAFTLHSLGFEKRAPGGDLSLPRALDRSETWILASPRRVSVLTTDDEPGELARLGVPHEPNADESLTHVQDQPLAVVLNEGTVFLGRGEHFVQSGQG